MIVNTFLKSIPLKAVIAIALVAVIGAGLLQTSSGRGPSFDREHSDLDIAGAEEFTSFPLYNAGDSFEGVPLLKITRRLDTPQAPDYYRTNFVNFIYGSCEVLADTGCLPPFQIQVWPGCIRNLSSYTMGGAPYPHERVTIRGVPGAVFPARVEVYTGRETVVIFAGATDIAMKVAENLESVNAADKVSRGDPLPAPAVGALDGELICTPAEYGPITPTSGSPSTFEG